ncbi:MAG: flagellar biosynthesis protein FlhF [Sulfurimonas sp.]|nr:MAG: flagellar biosynthesis protein FlhF [Sulfurimonas sp.]
MVRKTFKKISKSEKLKLFIKKYKIPREYLSTNRRMVSKAVFIGVFIAFIPMPMQMLLVVSFIPFTKFNVPIALSMCWLSNPFTMPPMYYMEYLTGSFLLGTEVEGVEMSLEWFSDNIKDIFIPLYIGAAFYSVIGSSLGFYLVNHLWKESVKKAKKLHRHHRK